MDAILGVDNQGFLAVRRRGIGLSLFRILSVDVDVLVDACGTGFVQQTVELADVGFQMLGQLVRLDD
jgi:hypothetical protein